ncbi:MAG: hypothetical protein HPY59_00900 [Anaerolineae bacterium]|nr:hypothetical protein [Anaerolineae bacterium]
MKTLLISLSILAALLFILWLGLQVKPRSFAMPQLAQGETKTIPLPEGLPAPVERFYRKVYGSQIPVIDTVVLTGRAHMRPFGVWLPARFVMVHNAGQDYRHYFEATFFGIPFLKVNEGYLDGKSFFESPMGTYFDDPNTNQGANLALWAEGAWFPSLWITDPRVRWQAVDDHTAILFVPFEDTEENFIVRFNPQTGLVDLMEAMRYRNPGDTSKVLWLTNEVPAADGKPAVSYATWLDAGKPWASFIVEEIAFNLDVSGYIQQRGY